MRRQYAVVLVVVLVALDVAAFAILRNRMSTPPEAPSTFDPSTRPVTPAAAEESPISGVLFLAGSDDGHLLRVTPGSCDDERPATVWVAPPGAPPAEVDVPGLVEALGARSDPSADRWYIVGTDADCVVQAWSSRIDGGSWEPSDLPAELWYADPLDSSRVMSARGPISLDANCQAVSVQVAGLFAYAVCEDGRVLEASRADREFSALPIEAHVVAFAIRPDGRAAAVTTSSSCLASVIQLREPRGSKVRDHCFGNTKAGLGVAWVGDEVAVQVGLDLMTNRDGEWVSRE